MSTQINLNQSIQTPANPYRKLLWVSPLAMALSTAANLALYAIAGAIAPQVTAWAGAGIGQIIGANCAYLFMGTILFALVVRFSAQPVRHYWLMATVGLLLSLGLPIAAGFGYGTQGAPAASVATVVTLSLMHVVSYAISTPLFTRQILT